MQVDKGGVYTRNHILDTGNHPQLAATIGTGFDIDCKDALQSLHPAHRGGGLVVVYMVPMRQSDTVL